MNAADTGFILICAAMVFVMTPAVALFYGGLVSARNVLSTSFHSYASLGLVTVIWAFVDRVKDLLKEPVIFDGRNQYDGERLKQRGFEYHCVGKKF